MEHVSFKNAYYIKLGRGGEWEESSIRENKVRIGWRNLTLEEINQGDLEAIKERRQAEYRSKGAATMDFNALRSIVQSRSEDIWITFHASYLWWCQVGEQGILEDEISRYRKVVGRWHNHDIDGNPLIIRQIPGSLSKVQRFQGVICKIQEVDDLRRLINNQPSEAFQAISNAKGTLASALTRCSGIA
jgi:hypothetical protein